METQPILTPFYLDEAVPGLEPLAGAGWQVNAPELPAGEKQARMVALYRPLAEMVADVVRDGKRPLSIAGDCCTTIGMLAGLQRAEVQPTLIWFDAHGDFNTWETTPSGFLGGMPLAMLVGRGDQTMPAGVNLHTLPDDHVILTDARDLDPGEAELVADSDVVHLRDVTQLLNYPLSDRPIYVHFDTDVLNPDDAPAMNYRTPGGPSAETLRRVFAHLSATGRVTAVSVSTWNPALDENGRSQRVVLSLLRTLLT